jgi:iron complex outermembrane receptor protein
LGGVVNVILKNNFKEAQVRMGYENTMSSDSPRRSVSALYGTNLESGRTRVMLFGSWSDQTPLLMQDRRKYFEANQRTVTYNNRPTEPGGISFQDTFAPVGRHVNVSALQDYVDGVFVLQPLVFTDGTPLGSGRTYVPDGIAPGASFAELKAALQGNAGEWDRSFHQPRNAAGVAGVC